MLLPSEQGLFEAVGSMNEAVSGLQALAIVQLAHVPKRLRWRWSSCSSTSIARPPGRLSRMGTTRSTSDLRNPTASRAVATMGDVVKLRDDTMSHVETLRTQTMGDVVKLRDETMSHVDDLRSVTVGEISQERRVVLEEIGNQRQTFVRELDGLTRHRVEEALAGANTLFGKVLLAGLIGGGRWGS